MKPARSIVLYEFASSGGLLREHDAHSAHLLTEGHAMLRAVAEDFAALEDTRVTLLSDHRLETSWPAGCEIRTVNPGDDDTQCLAEAASRADWTLVIAPETAGELERRARAVVAAGGRLLGPHPELIALAADKQWLCEHLENQNVPLPVGAILHDGEPLPGGICFPAVIKPRDGCGAEGVRLVHDAATLPEHLRQSHELRVENYCPGMAASVAILGGTHDRLVLPACGQTIELREDLPFHYRGGYFPLAPPLAARAAQLAEAVADALPDWIGYLGIDLVLGSAEDGSDDVAIEVNPRLTTSYVGLRAAARVNLAATMLALAGRKQPELSFSMAPLRFMPNGEIAHLRVPAGATP
jgi:hypothetical protein